MDRPLRRNVGSSESLSGRYVSLAASSSYGSRCRHAIEARLCVVEKQDGSSVSNQKFEAPRDLVAFIINPARELHERLDIAHMMGSLARPLRTLGAWRPAAL